MQIKRTLKTLLASIAVLAILAPGAAAQTPTAAISTVTVTAEGFATAPADTAYVQITLGKEQGFIDTAKEQIPGLEADTTPVDPAAVVDALVGSGVVASDITQPKPVYQGEWGPGSVVLPAILIVNVNAPTPESISAMHTLVMDTAHAEGYYVNSFNVLYAVNDCQGLRNAARADAIATARTEAEAQASAIDAPLGDILGTRDVQPMLMMGWQPGNCVRGFEIQQAVANYGIPAFNPNQPAEVTIWVGLEVTFEIL